MSPRFTFMAVSVDVRSAFTVNLFFFRLTEISESNNHRF